MLLVPAPELAPDVRLGYLGGISLGFGYFPYLCRYQSKKFKHMKSNLFTVIRESLESHRNGKERITINLAGEAKNLNIPFNVYMQIIQQMQDDGEIFAKQRTKDGGYTITFL